MIENIPQYVPPKGIDKNMFVVDAKDPKSIASVLKYIIDNFDDVFELLQTGIPAYEIFSFGKIDDKGKFVSLRNKKQYEEEAFSKKAILYPELFPLLAKLSKQILDASRGRTLWATEETILGQFIIKDLANKKKEYVPLLRQFIDVNDVIRESDHFQEDFESLWENICDKWNIDPDDEGDDENEILLASLDETNTYALYNEAGLDLSDVKLPEDTDFNDNSLDQKADTYEIWHNTALINSILIVLLERESFPEKKKTILKQYIADIPNFTDMYLTKIMNTHVMITCVREKKKGVSDHQTITFVMSENFVGINNSTNKSTMTHIMSRENKDVIIKLIKVHKPKWAKDFK